MARKARWGCVLALGLTSVLVLAGCAEEFHSRPTGDGGLEAGESSGGAKSTGGKSGSGGRRASGGSAGRATGGTGATGGAPPIDSGSAEASSGEAGTDPCEPAPPPVPGTIVAHCAVGTAPLIDGRLDDWAPEHFTNVVNHAASEPYGTWSTDETINDATLSAKFAVRWDQDALFVAAQIRDDVRSAPDTAHFYVNDAFELFLDGSNDEGEYGADDIQLLFDAMGRSQANHFPTLDPFGVPAGVTSAVTTAGVGASWNVEISVAWSALGTAEGTVGRIVGFDTAIDDNDTGARVRALVWQNRTPIACACAMAPNPQPCEPYCYAGTFYKVQLGGR
jgi:hypothetical protein